MLTQITPLNIHISALHFTIGLCWQWHLFTLYCQCFDPCILLFWQSLMLPILCCWYTISLYKKKKQTCLTAVPPDQPWWAGIKSVETTLHPLFPLSSWLPWNGLHNIKGRGLRAEPWGLLSWSWHSLSWFHRWWHPAGSFLKVCKEMFGDCRGGNFPINSHKALEANKPRWLNNFTPMAGQISGEIFVSCTGWHIKSRPLHFNAYNVYTAHTHWKFL